MKSYKQEGKVLEYSNAGSAISSGDVVEFSGIGIGVAQADIAATTGKGSVLVEGVVSLPKATPLAISQGARVYWDGTEITTTASDNTLAGFAFEAALSADTECSVKLVMMADTDPGNLTQAANSAALTEGSGAIGGTSDGDLPDLDATAATVTGTLTGTTDGVMEDVADIALSTADTYSDAAVNSAVNAVILEANLQLKELQEALNEAIADNVALRAGIRENSTKVNDVISKLKSAGLMASS